MAKGHHGGPSQMVQTVGQDYKLWFVTGGVSAAVILFPQCLIRLSLSRADDGIWQHARIHLDFLQVFQCQPSGCGSLEVAFNLESQIHHLAICFISPWPGKNHSWWRFLLVKLTWLTVYSFIHLLLLTGPVSRLLYRLTPTYRSNFLGDICLAQAAVRDGNISNSTTSAK